MARKSVMQHDFGQVARADIPRAQFDRSHGIKTTFDGGFLVPFLVDDIVPGDTVVCKATLFARLATPLKPVMDNMRLETFFFFIPNRLLWTNWQKFCGEQEDPGDSIDFTIPVISSNSTYDITTANVLYDYMGLPYVASLDMTAINVLPFRAYNLVYNEWFRDQNLQNSLQVDTDDGPDGVGQYILKRRGKRHDYFTSCLPWPQKGATAVSLPLGTKAEVTVDKGIGTDVAIYSTITSDYQLMDDGDPLIHIATDTSSEPFVLYADLSSATAATINQLRQAFAIQKLLERDARGGTRYIEVIKSHFGVTSSDARLQRPEYLGGGSSVVGIQPVAGTVGVKAADSPSAADEFQGNLSGIGTVMASGHGFMKSFEEHGIILGLVNVRADLTYQQGLERMWSRSTRYDFLWPVFSHIGEQNVLNQEIFYTSAGSSANTNTFGYNGRYDEYRHKPSRITGLFRSDNAASLDSWHLSQDFSSTPVLNDTFIKDTPPIDRVIAVPAEPHFIMDGYISYKHTRPLPVFGTPGLIDHF